MYFGPSTDGRDLTSIKVYNFKWGETLIEFNPRLNATDQVTAVLVRGWDPLTKEPISFRATSNDLPQTGGGGQTGPEAAEQLSSRPKEDIVVDSTVFSQEEAERQAVSRLLQRAYKFKTGTGRVIGQPKMRPGENVNLTGLGKRFSGTYQIAKVTHAIGSSGYTTTFDVESLREEED